MHELALLAAIMVVGAQLGACHKISPALAHFSKGLLLLEYSRRQV